MLNDFRVTKQWYQNAIKSNNRKLARQIAMSKEFLWPNIIEESRHLLGYLVVPFIESPSSAESQCAHLVKKNIANYSNSQDFDSLLFGCPFSIHNLSKSLRRKEQGKWTYKKITPILYDLSENLEILKINQFQLIDMGILIGTDYSPGVKGIGPKKALQLIKMYHNLENIILNENHKFDFKHLTEIKIRKIRKIFLLPDTLIPENLYWNVPNKSKVKELLCENHTLNMERVEKNLETLQSNYHKCLEFFESMKTQPKFIQKTLDMNFAT